VRADQESKQRDDREGEGREDEGALQCSRREEHSEFVGNFAEECDALILDLEEQMREDGSYAKKNAAEQNKKEEDVEHKMIAETKLDEKAKECDAVAKTTALKTDDPIKKKQVEEQLKLIDEAKKKQLDTAHPGVAQRAAEAVRLARHVGGAAAVHARRVIPRIIAVRDGRAAGADREAPRRGDGHEATAERE